MSDQTNYPPNYPPNREQRIVEETRVAKTGGATAFILGALAVAVLVIVWAVLSGADAPDAVPATGDNTVINEAPAAPDAAAPVETAPADPAAPAVPEDGAVDDGLPVPADPVPDDAAPAAPPVNN